MYFKNVGTTTLTLLLTWAILLVMSNSAWSQNNNDDDDESLSNASGVYIDPQGVMKRNYSLDSGRLSLQRLRAAQASYAAISNDVRVKSPMRYVSLNRMEAKILDSGIVSEEMKYLAGLQRIQYVFYFPETKDIVIAGPAEGWFPGYEGAMIGESTAKPVCELQDLVVALRAYAPGKDGPAVVGCSIDPTAEGNAEMQRFVQAFGRQDGPGRREAFRSGLVRSLGLQTVRVDGVPSTTHAAVVMVAADYRMKRIGIGIEDTPRGVNIETFISKVNPKRSGGNALFRWFFVPDYQSVVMTEDHAGMELIGSGVKLVAENEVVASDGSRIVQEGKVDPASKAFSRSFTKEYPKLAQKSIVFAQLRNFIDMLVCAAHIQQQDFYGQSGWSMEFFGNEEKFPVQTYSAPTHVEPVVGYAQRGNTFMAPIGGVEIDAELALTKDNVKIEENDRITKVREGVKLDLPADRWWWD